MDVTGEFLTAAFTLAEKVGGTLTITDESMLCIVLGPDADRADVVAAGITNDDFPFAYVIPHNDTVLRFEG